ncbi:MAG: DUF1801 domain-containing protein [Pseudomonadales bacterium]|nr:DUF1801 domain-containing protein [Pseudomonadales bacterium]
MDQLFRLSFGSRPAPEVERWFEQRPDELGHLARDWFDEMRGAGDDVLEMIHDGCPVACVEDVPFCYVNVFSNHVNVGFFRGAALSDPSGLLQGTGKRMRHVKVSPVIAYDQNALRKLIVGAYTDVKACLDT